MADEPSKAEIPKGEVQESPLTQEEFTAAMDKLVERARAAGVRPLRVMAESYVKQGLAILDGFLGAFEEGGGKKKKKGKR